MASMPAFVNRAVDRIGMALGPATKPAQARWNALESGPRWLILIGAVLLAAGFLLAFVWLPAVRARDALTTRLPQLEAQLAAMRSQANEVKALANQPSAPIVTRTIADVAALQAVFGPDAQITVADGGFRILIPAIAYASWWDKTGEAIARFTLVLRVASLARIAGPNPITRTAALNSSAPLLAVDMRLGFESQGAASPAAARQAK